MRDGQESIHAPSVLPALPLYGLSPPSFNRLSLSQPSLSQPSLLFFLSQPLFLNQRSPLLVGVPLCQQATTLTQQLACRVEVAVGTGAVNASRQQHFLQRRAFFLCPRWALYLPPGLGADLP